MRIAPKKCPRGVCSDAWVFVGLFPRWGTVVMIGVVACSRPPATPVAPAADRVAIVVAERGDHGIHLVGIDEHGDRQFELVRAAEEPARDTNPAISPDGKWIVFASSRG